MRAAAPRVKLKVARVRLFVSSLTLFPPTLTVPAPHDQPSTGSRETFLVDVEGLSGIDGG
jgi:hypothetical protein